MRVDLPAWLHLTLSPGVFPPRQRALLRAFGTVEHAATAPLEEASQVVPREVAEGLARGPDPRTIEQALRWLEAPGHHLLTLGDPEYPRALLETADPPTVLYVVGRTELLNAPALAMVGSRNATTAGLRDAEAFAQSLSDAGLTIVSGLALGIDAAAHRGGLQGAGSSIAVLGTGADTLYPKRNRELALRLAESGALVSEFPLGTQPLKENFPRRNRVISGLARGVLVVEAAPASGSLITARCALDQGREVFAIPGSIHSPLSKGCNQLIREGAKLVECANDVLEELRMARRTPKDSAAVALPSEQLAFLDAMGFEPVTADEIARSTGRAIAEVTVHLCELEIAGAVGSAGGGRFQRLANPVIE